MRFRKLRQTVAIAFAAGLLSAFIWVLIGPVGITQHPIVWVETYTIGWVACIACMMAVLLKARCSDSQKPVELFTMQQYVDQAYFTVGFGFFWLPLLCIAACLRLAGEIVPPRRGESAVEAS